MDDTISRKAAIEASDRAKALCADSIRRQELLDKFEPWLDVQDYNDGERNVIKAVLYEIKCMPPATDNNVATTDCISRQAAIAAIDKEQKEIDVSDVSAMYAYSKCKAIIKQLPPAQPKRGRWERGLDGYHAVCSNCESWWIPFGEGYKTDYHFCPNCGADMRTARQIVHDAIDNTTMAEDVYPGIKERLHNAVDDMREVTE